MSSAKIQGDEKIKQVSLNKDSSSSSSLSPVCARKESESFPSSLLHRSVWPLKVEYTHNPISHFVQSNSIAAVDSFPFSLFSFFPISRLEFVFLFLLFDQTLDMKVYPSRYLCQAQLRIYSQSNCAIVFYFSFPSFHSISSYMCVHCTVRVMAHRLSDPMTPTPKPKPKRGLLFTLALIDRGMGHWRAIKQIAAPTRHGHHPSIHHHMLCPFEWN